MIDWKKIDVYGQAILLLLLAAWLCLQGKEAFFLCCCVVGGWQALSTLVHLLFHRNGIRVDDRLYYEIILLLAVILFPIGGYFFVLLAPLPACWYLYICYREMKIGQKRRFIQLR